MVKRSDARHRLGDMREDGSRDSADLETGLVGQTFAQPRPAVHFFQSVMFLKFARHIAAWQP